MPNILDMAAYRERKHPQPAQIPCEPSQRTDRPPRINDAAIWSLDYTTFEGVVAGLLTIRAVCDYHLHFNEEWKHYLLALLARAFDLQTGAATGDLVQEAAPLKGYLAEDTTPVNRKEMDIAMLILDLIARRYVRSAPACGGKLS
ncbi:hypothetical protein [Oceanidesulfovibrio marinus]|uniref:Uncharacterized protein n=1 Tax=Oceanidesulfovibrio marinus TaxID=370038 RepID=A0A6P1ZL37_9BACT|nr:hypothetical protein [Oceanidesulfovibrio marinus]QJT09069.1 hypothetical protein E8L03_09055 [Oceanidesulfovibrio marinus]TVM36503.1 hypothetical protein DQK91_00830 [Oceanidesulfovibrio marinus]